MMRTQLEWKRILIFLLFAFGIAWSVAGVLYGMGGLAKSPMLIPSLKISWALVLIAVMYMPAPALAHVSTRWITGEGWSIPSLRLNLRRAWRYYLLAWIVVPLLATLLGSGVFFALYPQYFDPSLTTIRQMVEQSAPGTQLPPSIVLVSLSLVQGILLGGIINSPFTFGEEFGWRGYLQEKLMPLGWRKAMVVMGVVWGIWHWPIIAMGHNYGLDYPGYPWTGMLAMVWFCFIVGTFLGWVRLKSGSVWPAVVGHAAINAIAGAGALVVTGNPNPLLGPLATGVIAGSVWAILAIWLWSREQNAAIVESEASQ